MFKFNDNFDLISCNSNMVLKIIEKIPGDNVLLPFYWYDILVNDIAIGKISIRIGDNFHSYYNGHVGFEVDEEHRGNRYSLQALKLVLPVAKQHGMNSIYLTCRADNHASKRIIELSGAVHIEDIVPPKEYFAWYEGIEKTSIYRLEL